MDIIILVKSVPDVAKGIPDHAVDREKGTLIRSRLSTILNPHDGCAVELVFQAVESLKKHGRQVRTFVLSMGPDNAVMVIKDVMKYGFDHASLMSSPGFAGADTFATADTIAHGIKYLCSKFNISDYLVFCGQQSIDGDTAQVPAQIAQALGISLISYVKELKLDSDGEFTYTRQGRNGVEIIKASQNKNLLTITNAPELRLPTLRNILASEKKCIGRIGMDDISEGKVFNSGALGSKTRVTKLFNSPKPEKQCSFISLGEGNNDLQKWSSYIYELFNDRSTSVNTHSVTEKSTGDSFYNGNVSIYIEIENGDVSTVSRELLGCGRKLADRLNVKLEAVVIAHNPENYCAKLAQSGADLVCGIETTSNEYVRVIHLRSMIEYIEQNKPQIVLFGATPTGRELAPGVAYGTQSGLTADCTELDIGDHILKGNNRKNILIQTRPAMGGNIVANIVTINSDCQMASVRPGVFDALPVAENIDMEYRAFFPNLKDLIPDFEIVSRASGEDYKPPLDSAEIIICVGRGIESKVSIETYGNALVLAAKKFFNTSEVVLAATRAVSDSGWISADYQIWQTGRTVKPRLYIGLGVDGAIQHVEGMKNSD
ncbi:FAD-binding protein, partial [bacterium]|nr:FAD-binding protein [bacterium]